MYVCICWYLNTHAHRQRRCRSVISRTVFLAQLRLFLLIKRLHLNHPRSLLWLVILLKGTYGFKRHHKVEETVFPKEMMLYSFLHPCQEKAQEEDRKYEHISKTSEVHLKKIQQPKLTHVHSFLVLVEWLAILVLQWQDNWGCKGPHDLHGNMKSSLVSQLTWAIPTHSYGME